MAKVSIIITTHNRVKYLDVAVKSAKLAGNDIEIIVVDDASTDETPEFCQSLDGINYIRLERNQRTGGARNVGIVVSSSSYLVFLDDDDWLLPDIIDKKIAILENDSSCGLVYGQFLSANPEGRLLDEQPYPAVCPEGDVLLPMLESNLFGCMTAVIRKDVFYKVGLFDSRPEMYGIEDWDMWIRIAELYNFRAIKEPSAVYRKAKKETNQWSSNIPKQFTLVANAYKNKWLDLPRVKSELGSNLKTTRKKLLDSVAERIIYDMTHNSSGGLEKFSKIVKAVKCYPSKVTQLKFYKTLVKSCLSN